MGMFLTEKKDIHRQKDHEMVGCFTFPFLYNDQTFKIRNHLVHCMNDKVERI